MPRPNPDPTASGRPPVWVVLADHAQARLLRASRTSHGRTHLEQCDELAEQWDERQGHRQGPPHTAARHVASPGQGPQTAMRGGGTDWSGLEHERRRRFALDFWHWLQRHLQNDGAIGPGSADRPLVFAPPDLIGDLRKLANSSALETIELHQADLARLPQAKLLEERALEQALAGRWG